MSRSSRGPFSSMMASAELLSATSTGPPSGQAPPSPSLSPTPSLRSSGTAPLHIPAPSLALHWQLFSVYVLWDRKSAKAKFTKLSSLCKNFISQMIYWARRIFQKANIHAHAVSPESIWGINVHIFHVFIHTPLNMVALAPWALYSNM